MAQMLSDTLPISQAPLVCGVNDRANNPKMASELWQRIRAVRKHMEMNQETFGDMFGVSKAAVSQWESAVPKGRTRPGLETLQKISERSGAPLDWLISDDSDCDFHYWSEDNVIALSVKSAEKVKRPDRADVMRFSYTTNFLDEEDDRPGAPFGAMFAYAVQDAIERHLPRGWTTSANESRLADIAVFGPEKLACLVEVKTITQNGSRYQRPVIDALIGSIWRLKYMSKVGLEPASLVPPLFLVLGLVGLRQTGFVENLDRDILEALKSLAEHGVIAGFAVVTARKGTSRGEIEISEDVNIYQSRRYNLTTLALEITNYPVKI